MQAKDAEAKSNQGKGKNRAQRNPAPKFPEDRSPLNRPGPARFQDNHNSSRDGRPRGRGQGRKFGRQLKAPRSGTGRFSPSQHGKSSENSPAIGPAGVPMKDQTLEDGSPHPPNLKLGPGGGGDNPRPRGWGKGPPAGDGQQEPWNSSHRPEYKRSQPKTWGPTPEGLTDLSRKKYSVPWLLERRDSKTVKDCTVDLPDALNLRLHPPASQARRYPFVSENRRRGGNERFNNQRSPMTRGDDGGGHGRGRKDDEEPAWMEDQDVEKDFDFRVLEEGDKEHWAKYGTVKSASELKVLSLKEHEKRVAEKQEAEKAQRPPEEYQKPVTQHDILRAFAVDPAGAGGEEPFNPDELFGEEVKEKPKEQPAPPRAVVQSVTVTKTGNPDNMFMETLGVSHTDKPKASQPQQMRAPPNKGARPGMGQPQGPPGPMQRSGPNNFGSLHEAAMQQNIAGDARMKLHVSSGTQRSERVKAPMSVAPGQLAYASRSAIRQIRRELLKLGYQLVEPRRENDPNLTEQERSTIRHQEAIKRTYQEAIARANQHATNMRRQMVQKKQQHELLKNQRDRTMLMGRAAMKSQYAQHAHH